MKLTQTNTHTAAYALKQWVTSTLSKKHLIPSQHNLQLAQKIHTIHALVLHLVPIPSVKSLHTWSSLSSAGFSYSSNFSWQRMKRRDPDRQDESKPSQSFQLQFECDSCSLYLRWTVYSGNQRCPANVSRSSARMPVVLL